jgi:hypothetical protein
MKLIEIKDREGLQKCSFPLANVSSITLRTYRNKTFGPSLIIKLKNGENIEISHTQDEEENAVKYYETFIQEWKNHSSR